MAAQFGTALSDESFGVATDSSGNAYFSGTTRGSLDGPNAGFGDAIVGQYDPLGNLKWIRQLGTSQHENGTGVALDDEGRTFISGSGSGDAFIAAYSNRPTGDTNANGFVDAADYVLWRDNLFNVVTACTAGDADCNTFVNSADYAVWKTHFGEAAANASSSLSAVDNLPEPVSVALLLIAIATRTTYARRLKCM